MKKVLFVMIILLFGCAVIWANPVAGARGVVSYSEDVNVYFDSEANATRWLETQADFMSKRETTAAQRRIMETVMESMVPNFSMFVRMDSDFLVMISRSSSPGESYLMLFVRGVMTRLWQY